MLGAGLPQFACTQPVLGTPKPAEITSEAEPQELAQLSSAVGANE